MSDSTEAGSSVAIVVLAAGGSKRFGAIKQLAEINEKFLLQHVLDNIYQAQGDNKVFVVLGANDKVIYKSLQTAFKNIKRLGERNFLFNPDWQSGMASSIRCAVRELEQQFDAILFIAGDQPLVNRQNIEHILSQHAIQREKIIAAEYEGKPGIPALFPRKYFCELGKLSGDAGAKKLLAMAIDDVVKLAMPEAAVDIDTPEDLMSLRE